MRTAEEMMAKDKAKYEKLKDWLDKNGIKDVNQRKSKFKFGKGYHGFPVRYFTYPLHIAGDRLEPEIILLLLWAGAERYQMDSRKEYALSRFMRMANLDE